MTYMKRMLTTPGLEYPTLKIHADGSFAEDACVGSRTECVSPNLKTSRSPETLAGGPYTRDAIVGSSVVSVIPSMILLVITDGVFLSLVVSAAGANGCIHFLGNSEHVVRLWRDLFSEPRSGQDPKAFCLVDVVLCCCFMQSSLLRFLKLDIDFVLGVTTLCSLIGSASSFVKVIGHLQCCLPTLVVLASPYHANELDGACSSGTFVTYVDAMLTSLLGLIPMLPRPYSGENVGLLLSPCSEADFMVHRGASCCYAHMWDRLYFGTCVLVLCCSRGYMRLLGLNKLVASDWSHNYAFCYRLCVMLVGETAGNSGSTLKDFGAKGIVAEHWSVITNDRYEEKDEA
ncbi:hypothetical protein NC651_021620 [Populus alba x Populus x berolinensis]|nr:hypothetical protein NC651_021620 [Populus alba x Populus x berolinensis]